MATALDAQRRRRLAAPPYAGTPLLRPAKMNARASAPCAQRHAYVAMLTAQGNGTSAHDGSQGSFIQDALSHGALRSIVDQLAVLARSLRRFELCRHDFVLLLGVAIGRCAPRAAPSR